MDPALGPLRDGRSRRSRRRCSPAICAPRLRGRSLRHRPLHPARRWPLDGRPPAGTAHRGGEPGARSGLQRARSSAIPISSCCRRSISSGDRASLSCSSPCRRRAEGAARAARLVPAPPRRATAGDRDQRRRVMVHRRSRRCRTRNRSRSGCSARVRPRLCAACALRHCSRRWSQRRLAYLFGAGTERARPDGYWNYEPEYRNLGYATDPIRAAASSTSGRRATIGPVARDPVARASGFPAAERLAERSRGHCPAATAPRRGLPAELQRTTCPSRIPPRCGRTQACKAAIASAVAARSRIGDHRLARRPPREQRTPTCSST